MVSHGTPKHTVESEIQYNKMHTRLPLPTLNKSRHNTTGFHTITIGKSNFHKGPRNGLPPQLCYQLLTDEVVASPAVHKGQNGLIQNPLQVSLQH